MVTMTTTAAVTTKVPKFLRCLYDILHFEDKTILAWSHDGTHFQVRDVPRLERDVLPRYFKHSKFTSFQRQLNNFGFHKWTKTRANVCTFSHDALVQCHPGHLSALIATAYASWKASSSASTVSAAEVAAEAAAAAVVAAAAAQTGVASTTKSLDGMKRARDECELLSCSSYSTETIVKKSKLCVDTISAEDMEQLFEGLPTSSPLALLDAVDVSDLLALDWSQACAFAAGANILDDVESEDVPLPLLLLLLEPLSLEWEAGDIFAATASFEQDAFVDFGDEDANCTTIVTSGELLADLSHDLLQLEHDDDMNVNLHMNMNMNMSF